MNTSAGSLAQPQLRASGYTGLSAHGQASQQPHSRWLMNTQVLVPMVQHWTGAGPSTAKHWPLSKWPGQTRRCQFLWCSTASHQLATSHQVVACLSWAMHWLTGTSGQTCTTPVHRWQLQATMLATKHSHLTSVYRSTGHWSGMTPGCGSDMPEHGTAKRQHHQAWANIMRHKPQQTSHPSGEEHSHRHRARWRHGPPAV